MSAEGATQRDMETVLLIPLSLKCHFSLLSKAHLSLGSSEDIKLIIVTTHTRTHARTRAHTSTLSPYASLSQHSSRSCSRGPIALTKSPSGDTSYFLSLCLSREEKPKNGKLDSAPTRAPRGGPDILPSGPFLQQKAPLTTGRRSD